MAGKPSRDTEAPRLFVAIRLPEDVMDEIAAAFEPWRTVLPMVRWVPRENWHVTMRFLGSMPPSSVPSVRERLAQVAGTTAPFDTRVHGVGAFPSLRRAHVLWAGIDDDVGQLAILATAIQASLSSELGPEGRPFTPHVTVGRSAKDPVALQGGFGTTLLESDRFRVEEIVLMRSHLRRPASAYERIATYPMRKGAEPISG
jgi:RNA 2',3'-cyclic 3'-phosphodiesterase